MISGKDLRIGNIVRCTHHLPIGFRVPLMIHSNVTEIRESMVGTSEGFYKFTDIAPIPLTVDILLKAGARSITETEYIISKVTEKDPDIYILKEMNSFYLSTLQGGKHSMGIDYLHQLQNLYYVLTGRELNVSI